MEIDVLWPWRSGKSVGRTIYACPPGSSHRDGEILIGVMDTPDLASAVVEAHNVMLYLRRDGAGIEEIKALIARHEANPEGCIRAWGGYAICRLEKGHEGKHESGFGQWWASTQIDGSQEPSEVASASGAAEEVATARPGTPSAGVPAGEPGGSEQSDGREADG